VGGLLDDCAACMRALQQLNSKVNNAVSSDNECNAETKIFQVNNPLGVVLTGIASSSGVGNSTVMIATQQHE